MGLLAVFLFPACRSSRASQQDSDIQSALWQPLPILVDGQDDDWVKPLPYNESREKISFAVTNDKENIYILLSSKDRMEQQKILQGGITVWLNTKADKDENTAFGINYPMDSRNDRERALMSQARPQDYRNREFMPEDLKGYSLIGFNKDEPIENFESGQTNKEGIVVKIAYNRAGELIYEASVPLAAIYPNYNYSAYSRKRFAVGFFIEGITPPPGMRGGGGGGGGVSIGGGLGMGSFGSGGGVGLSIGTGSLGRIGGGGGNRQLTRQSKIWMVTTLAKPQ
jgi:hypothetical protein